MVNIAIAGLGTVGAHVVSQLRGQADVITERAGQDIRIVAVSARNRKKTRHCDLGNAPWHDDPIALAALPEVSVVVELIGGADGVALKLAEETLKNGKHLVTANKALLAAHGVRLAELAEKNKVALMFEAAVAGGIPIIKTLREALAGDEITAVRGILNGTCNYILTRMKDAGISFAAALKEAQALGYAEADPAADIEGHDAANKLALLAALAFGGAPNLSGIATQGISQLTLDDMAFAHEFGCTIKLLGVAEKTAQGVEQRVAPVLVPQNSALAQVSGVLNAVQVRGRHVGDITLQGAGAGGPATANAVVADIIDLARGIRIPAFGRPAATLKTLPVPTEHKARHYMRLMVRDEPGVVADVSAILRDNAISIKALVQHGEASAGVVPVVLLTHPASDKAMKLATEKIGKLRQVTEPPCLLRMEE